MIFLIEENLVKVNYNNYCYSFWRILKLKYFSDWLFGVCEKFWWTV